MSDGRTIMSDTQGRALIGHLYYEDGSCAPAVILDFSNDPDLSRRAEALYGNKGFDQVALHVEGDEVSIDAGHDLLDGRRAEHLSIRFVPEDPEDIDAFMCVANAIYWWALVFRVSDREYHFLVSIENERIGRRSQRRGLSEIKKINIGEGRGPTV